MSDKRPKYHPGKNPWRPLDVGEWLDKWQRETGGAVDTPADLTAVRAKQRLMIRQAQVALDTMARLNTPPMTEEDKRAGLLGIQWRAAEKNALGVIKAMGHIEREHPAMGEEGRKIRRGLVLRYLAAKRRQNSMGLAKATTRYMRAHGALQMQVMGLPKPADWHKATRWEDLCPPPDAEGAMEIIPTPSPSGGTSPLTPLRLQRGEIMPVIDNGRDSYQLSVVSRQQTGGDKRAEESEAADAQRRFEQKRAAANAQMIEELGPVFDKYLKVDLPKDAGGEVPENRPGGVLVLEMSKNEEGVYVAH
jgi:hypothetical protein